ncbi:DUF669 domain-containing protein [Shouchella clausii]|uniref:DUF669 domain-containing protein n=1 Tax=Shouchella clausii TaxID=79880 RepID=UPI0026F46112|nr:DUF669 domain-containing protein [Shouchella clausii]MDO7281764.1 DUF669 domain-containing protein [Shouchella clausii]MDO7301859.1 DUF669 domain-containing protein [Shouchella clausii]
MSVLKVDYTKVSEFEEWKKGEYEVTVVGFEMTQAKTGSNMVVLTYEVRDDVDQPCKGQKINYDNFVVSDKSLWRFHALSKAVGVPEGTDFESFTEWAKTMQNKPVRVVVGLREQNGRNYPQVNGFKPSEVGKPSDDGSIDIKDDDVPF